MTDVVTIPTPEMKEKHENGTMPELTDEMIAEYEAKKDNEYLEALQAISREFGRTLKVSPEITINGQTVGFTVVKING